MSHQLLNLAKSHGINIEFFPLKWPILGLYYRKKGLPPYIGLADTLKEDNDRLRCVLAEEIGHHVTTSGKILSTVKYSNAHKIAEDRAEYVAVKWAAQHLLPFNKLKTNLSLHETSEEIAKKYRVTEKMAKFRLSLIDVQRFIKHAAFLAVTSKFLSDEVCTCGTCAICNSSMYNLLLHLLKLEVA